MSAASPTSRTAAGKSQSLTMPVVGIIAAVILIIVGALIAGSRNEDLTTTYGRRRGSSASRSVNGTAVLAELFKRAGHRVTTFTRFSPRVNDFDILVWLPDDFEPPTKEQREFLETWLKNGAERTVIYIGRDYDAAVSYWERIAPQVPPREADEALRREAEARAEFEAERSKMPIKAKGYARWFTVSRDEKPEAVKQLGGPWAKGVDAAKTEIRLEGRLAIPSPSDAAAADPSPPKEIETLLSSDELPIVFRERDNDFGDGQIIVVSNGSFVLNFPLVNQEHRKLAARLVNECGPAARRVVFIESGPGLPRVLDKEPSE